MRYELKDLRLFRAIEETGNLSAGAAAMHMTASSASYRLKNLEYAVGRPLFTRTPRGMTLTPAGEVLSRHARTVLDDVQSMHDELLGLASNLKGSIRLLANSSSLNSFIIPSLARFLSANSRVNVDLKEQESSVIPQSILNDEADIGVAAASSESDELESQLYAQDTLICAVHPDHPLATQQRVPFARLLDYDFVSMDRNSSNFLFLAGQARAESRPLNVRIHAHDFRSVLYLVQAEVGIALVPASIAHEYARDKRVVPVAIAAPWATRNLYMITRRQSGRSKLIHEFADILMHDPQVVASRACMDDGSFQIHS